MGIWKRMPRRRLMQRERRQVVQRPARQVVGVEQIHARPTAARRIKRRQVIRHRLDRKARPRQIAEEQRRLAIKLLGNPRRPHQQLIRRLRIELRIRAQELQKRRKIPLNPVSFMTASISPCSRRHLRLAQRVNLRRIHIERGEFPDLRRVEIGAIRQILRRQRRAQPGTYSSRMNFSSSTYTGCTIVTDDRDRLRPAGLPAPSAEIPGMSLKGV